MVCDAGGSTVDITTYDLLRRDKDLELKHVITDCTCPSIYVSESLGLSLPLLSYSEGVHAGGIYINAKFEEYVTKKLQLAFTGSMLGNIVAAATGDFEIQAKRTFQSPAEGCSVPLRGNIWDDPSLGIKDGSLQIDGLVSVL